MLQQTVKRNWLGNTHPVEMSVYVCFSSLCVCVCALLVAMHSLGNYFNFNVFTLLCVFRAGHFSRMQAKNIRVPHRPTAGFFRAMRSRGLYALTAQPCERTAKRHSGSTLDTPFSWLLHTCVSAGPLCVRRLANAQQKRIRVPYKPRCFVHCVFTGPLCTIYWIPSKTLRSRGPYVHAATPKKNKVAPTLSPKP